MNIHDLQQRWLDLLDCDRAQKHDLVSYFEFICDQYSQEHRYYHNLGHVAHCLNWVDEVRLSLNNQLVLELAIWFHDIVYDPDKNDNEQQSAYLAMDFLAANGFNCQLRSLVERYILLTRHSCLASCLPASNDEKYLIDIDLSILAADRQAYDNYECAIRKEYAFVPQEVFREGRKKVLERFMAQSRIFHSDYFYIKLEALARANLKRALAKS